MLIIIYGVNFNDEKWPSPSLLQWNLRHIVSFYILNYDKQSTVYILLHGVKFQSSKIATIIPYWNQS